MRSEGKCAISISQKIGITVQPIFVSKKLEQDLKPEDAKPAIVNQQCVVYLFSCDRCYIRIMLGTVKKKRHSVKRSPSI